MRNLLLLSAITSTIACQEQTTSNTTSTDEATQQRVELQPNLSRMTDSFQQYVDRQVNDFAFTQSKLAELQPTGPECLFGGEVQGQIDMSQTVPAWHIDLSDDHSMLLDSIELFHHISEPTAGWEINADADELSFSLDHLTDVELDYAPVTTEASSAEITLQPERVTVEIDLSRTDDQAQLNGEWYICVEYAQ